MEEILRTSILELPNSKSKLQERFQLGKISWPWPGVVVFARLIFAFAAQATLAGLYSLLDHPTPWQAAAPWWVVYGTMVDVGCFAFLWRLTRKEGVRLRDLISFEKGRFGADLLHCLLIVILFTILFLAGGMIFGALIYGATKPPLPYGKLPIWGALYSILVWPIIWGIAEQMTYLGYSLPRLEILSGRRWQAVAIVCFGWSIQHIALPFMFSWQWVIYRFAATLPLAIVLPLVYLRTRRLLPFIVAHCVLDAAGTLVYVFLPLIQ
jgi:membrane protease YdiL (CAAX protease family)